VPCRAIHTGVPKGYKRLPKDQLLYKMRVPNPDRIYIMFQVRACLLACVYVRL
jgi:hypothetical protein